MDIDFATVDDLVAFLEADIKDVLEKDVAAKVKMIEQEVIDDVVYGWGEPEVYERRYDYEGLSDLRNMTHEVEKIGNELILSVSNETRVSDYAYNNKRGEFLDEIIEYGTVGRYTRTSVDNIPPYSEPRPFTEETQNEVNKIKLVENVLRNKLDYIE